MALKDLNRFGYHMFEQKNSFFLTGIHLKHQKLKIFLRTEIFYLNFGWRMKFITFYHVHYGSVRRKMFHCFEILFI